MIYIYAPSMAVIVRSLKHWKLEELCVISFNDAIIKFCNQTDIKCIVIKSNNDSSITGLLRHKRYIKSIARSIHNQDIHFGHNSYDYWGLYLIKLLSKDNKISFFQEDFDSPTIKITPRNFFELKPHSKDLVILKTITNLPLKLFKTPGKQIHIGIEPQKLSRLFNSIESSCTYKIFEDNKILTLNKYELNDCLSIFIDQGNSTYNIPDAVIETLTESRIGKNIFVKEHPRFNLSNKKLESFKQIPREIPIELMISNNISIIGIYSTALINSKCKVKISLIHLVEWQNQDSKEYAMNLLSNDIICPRNIFEFEYLINTL